MLVSKGMRIAGTFTTRNKNMFRRSLTAATARAMAFPAATRQQARVFGLVLAVTCAATSTTMILPSYDTNKTYNHCQVPCGIFDDPAMVMELQQAVVTIRKAMAQTQALVAGNGNNNNNNNINEEALAVNQAVRWIHVKEQHANRIIHLVTDYCLCQRVKRNLFPNQAAYWEALQIHHQVLQAAMKAKQSVSEVDVDALQVAVNDLAKMYTE